MSILHCTLYSLPNSSVRQELFLITISVEEVEWLPQGHIARKWQNSDSDPRLSNKIKFLYISYVLTSPRLRSRLLTQPISCRQARTAFYPLYISTFYHPPPFPAQHSAFLWGPQCVWTEWDPLFRFLWASPSLYPHSLSLGSFHWHQADLDSNPAQSLLSNVALVKLNSPSFSIFLITMGILLLVVLRIQENQ